MVNCTCNLLNMFRALVCPSLGARDYTCVIAAYSDKESCSSSFPHPGRIACCSAPDHRPPANKAVHTKCGNNTSIVVSSRGWAYNCPKHVEQIISAINHSVASSWFSSLRICLSNLLKSDKFQLFETHKNRVCCVLLEMCELQGSVRDWTKGFAKEIKSRKAVK